MQPLPHEDPVFIDERHDVGHRAEGGQADRSQEHLAEPGCDPRVAAGPRRDRPGEFEGDAGAAELSEGIGRAGEARMHEHVGVRERVAEGVVIGDDEFEAELTGPRRLGDARDAAIDRDDEARSLGGERLERRGVESVALLDPVGHVPDAAAIRRRRARGIECLEAVGEDRRGAHAVGVVVAIDDDAAARPDRREDAVGRLRNAGQRLGVAEVGERACKEGLHRRRVIDAPGCQERRDDARHAGRPLEPGHGRRVVRPEMPPLGHARLPSCSAFPDRPPPAARPGPGPKYSGRGRGPARGGRGAGRR